MAAKPLPDQAMLLKLLRYDPETGKLYWRERTPDIYPGHANAKRVCAAFNAQFAGKEAFTAIDGQGYAHGTIFRESAKAHRVIWKMITGDEAPEVMRLRGSRTDNRASNLLGVNRRASNRNSRRRSDNRSGVAGVCWHKATNKWIAWICEGGNKIHLGLFPTIEGAKAVRDQEMLARGYFPGHGREVA